MITTNQTHGPRPIMKTASNRFHITMTDQDEKAFLDLFKQPTKTKETERRS